MKLALSLSLLLLINLSACIMRKGAFKGSAFEEEAQGFDQAQLAQLDTYIEEHAKTTGLVVLHKGKMVYQYGNIKKVSYLASCRKSVLAMLYGKYVDNGSIDLNQEIGALGISEKDGLLPIEKKATVDHIITSRSGVFHVASNGGYDLANFKARGSVEPGAYFVYSNWDFNVAGALFEKFAGRSIYEEMEDQLAKPLGFQDWHIKNQRKSGNTKKSQYKAYHFYLSTRDMAKMGQLMLNEGNWEGKQLISKEWIRKITSTVTPQDTVMARSSNHNPKVPAFSYGYMWWLFDEYMGNTEYEGSFTATGYGGQYITVIPKAELVIAHKTKLSLPAMIGLTYMETSPAVYFTILDKLMKARN